MEAKTPAEIETTRMLPLLRSIAREVRDRTAAVQRLESRRGAFAATPRIHEQDLLTVDAELSVQRRELRMIEKELARLGCTLDEDNPHRILVPSEGKAYTFTWQLDDTQFHHRPVVDSTT